MSLFTDIGYARLAAERKRRFEETGRRGESLGFYNRPDLNHPWDDEPESDDIFTLTSAVMCALIIGGSLIIGWLAAYASHHLQ